MNRRLIPATLAAAALLALLYALAIQLARPDILSAPTVGLYNRVFLERYVYGEQSPIVMVGSSLTARLPAADLGPGIVNLALNGQSAMTGLAVVAKSPQTPQRVLIEINQIGLGSDAQVLAQTFDEPLFTLRRHVLALRKSYQPVTVFYGLLRGRQAQDNGAERPMTPAQHAELVKASAQALSTAMPKHRLDDQITEMRGYLETLRARGITPVFYEMPIDGPLRALPLPTQVRQAMQAAFPAPAYCWITPNMQEPRTVDGLHLALADAALAARRLRESAACAR